MTARHLRHLVAIATAYVLLSAQSCQDLATSTIVTTHSGKITVENNATEVVFVLLYADDARAAGNLKPGGTSTITTHIDGAYHVVVAASGLQLGNYEASLTLLREATEDVYHSRGQNDQAKITAAQTRVGTARQNLEGLFQTGLAPASCAGTVRFKIDFASPPPQLDITASVTKSGDSWAATCPSGEQ